MQKHQIQKAKSRDYIGLIQLWEASVNATHHFLSEKDIQTYKLLIREYYFDQLSLYYIRKGNDMIGFIGLKKDFIQMLFILPEEMGKGFGRMLIDFAVQKHKARTVDVNEQNTSAMGFYKKLGFYAVERSEIDGAGKPFPVISLKLAV